MPALPAPSSRAPQSKKIDVSLEDRWLILGATGTGKTTFARELLKQLRGLYPDVPVYILDSKGYGDFAEWHGNGGLVASETMPPPIKKGIQIWQPGVDDQSEYAAWFDQLLRTPGPAITLVDEISSIGNKKGDAPREFERLLKQGRALGKLTINCSQEMAYVPKQIKTQTTHVVRFRMAQTGYDNQKANQIMGRPNTDPEPSERYGFFYRRIDKLMDVAEYATYKDFF
jgi:energy-coupling factor transporter ATP-binding protein EcfA2